MDKIIFKNGSIVECIPSNKSKRSIKIRYYWKYNEKTQKYERLEIEPDSEIDKIIKTEEYYRQHPDEFAEKVLGIKLFWYQKMFLKYFLKNKEKLLWLTKRYY